MAGALTETGIPSSSHLIMIVCAFGGIHCLEGREKKTENGSLEVGQHEEGVTARVGLEQGTVPRIPFIAGESIGGKRKGGKGTRM